MCKQSWYGKVNYSPPKKALSLIVIAGLLAFPVISAGQIPDSWKPGVECCGIPVLVDVKGDGFKLTNAANGCKLRSGQQRPLEQADT